MENSDTDTQIDLQLFFKSGYDDKCFGACYQSQRVLMLAELKRAAAVLPSFESIPVNISKPPKTFTELGLHLRVPALYLNLRRTNLFFEPVDIADDIVVELETRYPGGLLKNGEETEAESATSDFFSKFCHWMRGVAKDSSHLEAELVRVDRHLGTVSERCPDALKLFLCGEQPALIDCEVLPKLHQVRVATDSIKGYQIPIHLTSLWRYLHSAYSEPAFVNSCPSDTEILLHWLDKPRQQQLLAASSGKPPSYSFTVPAIATKVVLE